MSVLRYLQNGIVTLLAVICTVLGIVSISMRSWYLRSSATLDTIYGLFSICEQGVCSAYTYPTIVLTGCITSPSLWQQFQVASQAAAVISVVCGGMACIGVVALIVTPQEQDTKMLSTYTDTNFVARLPSLSRPGGWRMALRVAVMVFAFFSLALGWSTVGLFGYWYTKGLYCGETPCREVSPLACTTTFGASFGLFIIASCAATMLFICAVVDVAAAAKGRSTLLRGRILHDDLPARSMAYKRASFMRGSAPTMRSMSMSSFYPGNRNSVVREVEVEDKRPATPPAKEAARPAMPDNFLRPISHQPIFPFLPPDGDWATGPDIGDLFWSETEQIFFDPNSGQFYDPHSEHWYDPEIDQWYHL